MSKLEIYKDLLEKMKNVKTYLNITEDVLMRGNLAYFVDCYSEDQKWDQINAKLQDLLKQNDANEICWYLYDLIYKKYLNEYHKSPIEKIDFIKNVWAMNYEAYRKKRCSGFTVVREEFFPKFFYSYEYLEDLLKK